MSTEPGWLQQLQQATDYRALQGVLTEIVAQARGVTDQTRLAECIDEAIRRLTLERARDEAELRVHQEQYDAFREEQSGVVGWFKRHLPFSETRRQELSHRGTVSDQEAEIRADNFIIARAQMVKEQFLAPAHRRLGERPSYWRGRLAAADTPAELHPCAAAVRELATELQRSEEFLTQLKVDVEAFAEAAFVDKEDRQRRDTDLQAGRAELQQLVAEVNEEQQIRQSGVKQLGQLVVAELTQSDPEFRAASDRLRDLTAVHKEWMAAQAGVQEFWQAAEQLGELERKLRGLPEETRKLEHELHQRQQALDDANRQHNAKKQAFDQIRGAFESAQQEVQQSQRALATARQMYEAYQREHGAADPGAVHVEATSPVEAEYYRVRQSHDQAEARLRAATPSYETARQAAEDSDRRVATERQQVEKLQTQRADVEKRADQLRQDIRATQNRLQPAGHAAQRSVASYLVSVRNRDMSTALPGPEPWSGATSRWGAEGFSPGFLESFVRPGTERAQSDAISFLEKVKQALVTDGQQIQREQKLTEQRWQSGWAARCDQLLDATLAQEVRVHPPATPA